MSTKHVRLGACLPLVSDNGFGFGGGGRLIARVIGLVLRILGQHLFGAVQRIGLPNATAVPIQVVALRVAALVLVRPLSLVTPNRSTDMAPIVATTYTTTASSSHAPVAVVVRLVVVVDRRIVAVVLPVVVVVVTTSSATAHLQEAFKPM